MFTTIEEPRHLINALRKSKEGSFEDTDSKILRFLRQQYEYEINRTPMHNAFEKTYKRNSFEPNAMLQYYMNPWGNETKEQYYMEIQSSNSIYPIIHKRTLN